LVLLLVIFVLGTAIGSLTGLKKTPRDKIGISYGGGPFEGQHFQGIVDPGHALFENGMWDHLYLYPVTQRNYIISKNPAEGERGQPDFVPAPSSDRIEVDFEVAAYFKLNTNKLQRFHEQIGLKYQAWTDEGWIRMLNDSFRQQIENTMQLESRKYPVAQIYSDPNTIQAIQQEVAAVLKERVTTVLGDEYFCGPGFNGGGECPDYTFVIKRVTIPDNVVQSYQDIKVSENKIQVRQNEVQQAQLQADAIRELNEALKGAGDQYVMLQAIQSGKVTFWIIPQGNNLTLQGPQSP
jgi:SPFH domain/Band 7 family protein